MQCFALMSWANNCIFIELNIIKMHVHCTVSYIDGDPYDLNRIPFASLAFKTLNFHVTYSPLLDCQEGDLNARKSSYLGGQAQLCVTQDASCFIV